MGGGAAGPTYPGPALPTDRVLPHLVVQGELTEGWDVLGPLDEHQQLLFHGLTHIRDAGDLLRPNVAVDSGDRGGDLAGTKENAGVGGAPLHILCPLHRAPTLVEKQGPWSTKPTVTLWWGCAGKEEDRWEDVWGGGRLAPHFMVCSQVTQ